MDAIVAELHTLNLTLNRLLEALQAQQTDATGPNLRRSLDDYPGFVWASIGAEIIAADADGPTILRYQGQEWKRRTHPKFGQDIWYSRATGRDEQGNVAFARLITFGGEDDPVEPLPEKLRRRLPAQPATPAPPAPPTPPTGSQRPRRTPPAVPAATPPAAAASAPPERSEPHLNGQPRPYPPDVLKTKLQELEARFRGKFATPQQRNLLVTYMELAFAGAPDAQHRRLACQQALWGNQTIAQLPHETILVAMQVWLKPTLDTGNAYAIDPIAAKELQALYASLQPSTPAAAPPTPASQLDEILDSDADAAGPTQYWLRVNELKRGDKLDPNFNVQAAASEAQKTGDWNAALRALNQAARF